jgi:hypothetical protein
MNKKNTIMIDITQQPEIVSSKINNIQHKNKLQSAIDTAFQEQFVYEFAKNHDNLTTVTIEPLVKQVTTVFNNCKNIDQSKMSDDEKRGIQFTLDSTNQVYHFLTALLAEAYIKLNSETTHNAKNTTH